MSKYIDLADRIKNDTPKYAETISSVLEWLDDHPDQAPGRTITRRDFEDAFDFHFDDEDIDRHERFLAHLGITVAPDPKPTNVELLEGLQRSWVAAHPVSGGMSLIEYLDKAGVKAPDHE